MHSQRYAQNSEIRFLLIMFGAIAALLIYLEIMDRLENHVSQTRCINANRFWQEEIEPRFRFHASWEAKNFDCPSNRFRLVEAMRLMAKTTIGGQNETYFQWMTAIEPNFEVRRLFRFTGKANFAHRRILLAEEFLAKKPSVIETAGVIVHEARHLEEGLNTHVPCRDHPIRQCDAHLAEPLKSGGAYSYGVMFYLDLIMQMPGNSSANEEAKRLLQSLLSDKFNHISKTQRDYYNSILRQ